MTLISTLLKSCCWADATPADARPARRSATERIPYVHLGSLCDSSDRSFRRSGGHSSRSACPAQRAALRSRLDPGAEQQSEQDEGAAGQQPAQHDVALQLAHALGQLRDLRLQRLVARLELLVLFVVRNRGRGDAADLGELGLQFVGLLAPDRSRGRRSCRAGSSPALRATRRGGPRRRADHARSVARTDTASGSSLPCRSRVRTWVKPAALILAEHFERRAARQPRMQDPVAVGRSATQRDGELVGDVQRGGGCGDAENGRAGQQQSQHEFSHRTVPCTQALRRAADYSETRMRLTAPLQRINAA